ncbi:hypothetical protein L1887_35024 [Cichorium endivia]|nr:hypothetical protein L1887_35024 [Cichorium endivia]
MQRKILSRDNNYITNLPESITETIIIKLPLKDAVRTIGIDPIELQNLISSCPALKSLNISNYDSLELTIRAPNLKFLTLEGNTFGKTDLKYQQLKVIDLSQVSFDTMKEIMVLLRLILNAPNLEELQIAGSSDSSSATKAPDLGFWEKQCRFDLTFDQLKTVKMMEMFGVPHEVGFIGFLLGNSPLLETMSITPSVYMTKDRFSFLIQLTKLKRRPTEAEMIFVQS